MSLRYRQLGGCTYDEKQKEVERTGKERLVEHSIRVNEHTWKALRSMH